MQAIEIETVQALTLNMGDVYTVAIFGLSNNLIVSYSDTNPYIYGRASFDDNADLVFVLEQDVTTPEKITLTNNDLAVNGRIKDKTGYTTFPGEIKAFAGSEDKVPDGWLLCDGKEVSRLKYPYLFNVIGTNWGAGDHTTTFHLPDGRGQVLRGISGDSDNDPNKDERIASNIGGNIGNKVGSKQLDALKAHHHYLSNSNTSQIYGGGKYLCNRWPSLYELGGSNDESFIPHKFETSSTGASETRVKNINVHFIIKY